MGVLARKKHNGALISGASSQLSRELRIHQLTAIGVGTTIGAGIFILIGTVGKEHTGPALPLSFLIAGIAAALSALNYAELSSRLPSAGSAYHYAYTCLGEGIAWIVGWSIILEYTVSGATVARGVSPNVALFLGKHLPFWLDRTRIPGTDIVVDPFAGFLVIITTCVLCTGIKQSAGAQMAMTVILILVLLFVDSAGVWAGVESGWRGYKLSEGYLPYGLTGVLHGGATLFFSYIGFDALATTAEEVKNPQRDLPIGIGLALFICASLYMSVSAVVVGIEPYYKLNPDTPISTAFAESGMQWASYVVAIGALTAMLTTMLGCFLPQPRILMTMARDGLLPSFFSVVHRVSAVPVNSAIVTGAAATLMTIFMDVEQLSEMVSVGTLVAFTSAGLCILVIRYAPPHANETEETLEKGEDTDLIPSASDDDIHNIDNHRMSPVHSISCVVAGSFLLSLFLSLTIFPLWIKYAGATIGFLAFSTGAILLILTPQDESHRTFGKSGGFLCPLVPTLPVVSVLINIYLLLNVGTLTWIRVSMWLVAGILVYAFYGVRHSVHR